MFISLFNLHIIIPPANVQIHVDVGSMEVGEKVRNEREQVLIADGIVVDVPIVLHQM